MTSLWLDETAPFASSALPARTEVAVIGGGLAGIATALHLARRGVAVTVLERGVVAGRASGRNDGQLLLGLGEHYHRIHGQFGAERARLLWGFLRDNHAALRTELAASTIACELVQAGGLRLAETGHEWRELGSAAALLAAEHEPHTLIEAHDLDRWLPPARGFHGALFLPGEAIVQPVRMVRGLAAEAVRAGARVVEHAAVTEVRGEAGEFEVALQDGRTLASNLCVHCTSALAPELDPTGLLARTVFPFRGQIVASERLPDDLAARFPPYAMSSNFCYEYFRVANGRFVVGGKRWSVPGEESGLVDDGAHNPAVTHNLLQWAREHFPALRDVAFPHVWTGIMAGTPDGLPLLGGLPGRPGAFALLGFNGYGLSFAFLAGRCLAETIVDGRATHAAMSLFAPRRFAAD